MPYIYICLSFNKYTIEFANFTSFLIVFVSYHLQPAIEVKQNEFSSEQLVVIMFAIIYILENVRAIDTCAI